MTSPVAWITEHTARPWPGPKVLDGARYSLVAPTEGDDMADEKRTLTLKLEGVDLGTVDEVLTALARWSTGPGVTSEVSVTEPKAVAPSGPTPRPSFRR